MIKVITTVGTSLFENFLKRNDSIRNHYDMIKDKPYSQLHNYNEEIDFIIKALSTFAKDEKSSAEIKTLKKIKQEENDELEIIFFCTDTTVSYLAAEILKDHFNKEFNFTGAIVINGLQTSDFNKYDTLGFSNLIKKFREIILSAGSENQKILLNVSGGTKLSFLL